MRERCLLIVVLALTLFVSPQVRAQDGPLAELRLETDIDIPPRPWPLGSVLLGWRIDDRWSVGVSYSPLRLVFQDMRQGNDTSASPIMLSGLHAVGDFWFKTGSAWGGKAGIQFGALMPYLGVAEPGRDMSGMVAEGLLSASWGFMGRFLAVQAFASAGWKWGQLENNTHERPQVGYGPIIIDQVDVFAPTFLAGLAVAVWL